MNEPIGLGKLVVKIAAMAGVVESGFNRALAEELCKFALAVQNNTWIPVSELPEESGCVAVAYFSGRVCELYYSQDENIWQEPDCRMMPTPDFWQPMPEPPNRTRLL